MPSAEDQDLNVEVVGEVEETVYLSANDDDDSDEILKGESLLKEQRETLEKLLEQQSQTVTEGTLVNVIYASWINGFIGGDYKTVQEIKEKLGPIDTNGIINDNGIFCDFNAYPLYVLIPDIYNKLVEWYGLTPNSKAVTTYVISRNQGSLEPEFAKPSFYLHHLVADSTNSSYSSSYSSIPLFAISTLNTFNDLVQLSIEKLEQKEKISRTNKKYRLWIITDDDLINLNYLINPKLFMNFKNKILIKKQFLSGQIKNSGLNHAHLIIEEKKIINTKNKKSNENYWPSNFFIHHPPSPSDGRIGLQNLGNTCYMNSALQCLVHIPELTQYFLFNCYEKELNPSNPLGMDGKVATSFANLIHNLFDKKSNRGTSFTPREFKQTIGHFNSMFGGYHQQDSQEFLAFLLDGLHEDLNRIIKKPITEKPELNEKDSNNQEAINELAVKSWDQHKLRNDSIIIDLFTGLYKSTLICPDCSKISITFDPFSDLTLPLPINNLWSGKVLLFLENGPIKQFEIELTKNSTYKTLKTYVANKLSLDPKDLFTCEIWSDQFYKNFESSESQSGYLPISDLISSSDIIVMYEVRHSEKDLIVPILNTVLPDSGIPSAFGVPFFISLNEEERNSFGLIRKKIELKYEQLSTYQYFSKVRSNEILNKRDVDMKDEDQDVEIIDEDCCSDHSLDVSEISGEFAFKIKLFDASKQTKIRRKNYNYSHKSAGKYAQVENMHEEGKDEKVWTPNTNNNFTKLPELINLLDEKKKSSYETKDLKKNESEEDLKDYVQVSPIEENPHSNSESPDSVDEHLNSLADKLEKDKLSDSIKLEEASTAKSGSLIDKRIALICEWDPEYFDIFFSGLEEKDKGGNNTWTNPEILVNEEVEESKRLREEESNNEITLDQCLKLFSKPEILGEHDLWYCSNCKEHRQASKQIEIWSTPDILSIHLKRFENQRSFSDKIDAVVEFPIEGLDISPYLSTSIKDSEEVIYDLFAVDNHFGGLGGGHYTSYVKNFVDNEWYYYDDSRVSKSSPEKSISGAAYLLFYRKRSSKFLGGDKLGEMLEKAREAFEQQQNIELENLENFYRQNKESSSEEEEEEEQEEEQEQEQEQQGEPDISESPNKQSDDEASSSDNVSSIPVGSDDENATIASRRKQRLISRGTRFSRLASVEAESASSEDGNTYSPPIIPGSYPSPKH